MFMGESSLNKKGRRAGMKQAHMQAADISKPPRNGELLLSYWRRIGGTFDAGFMEQARAAVEAHGFYYERAHVYKAQQMTMKI